MVKRKIASAIGYSKDDLAPVLLVSGRGAEAEKIIAIAKEAGVTVMEDASLAALLDSSAKPGDIIPQWCWEAAAKALAFVMKKERSL
ncbi:MAG: EscU/YscU/HrcU family type III secretion system export apparatus switch protein [Treponema sp.]|jgi:flagellar biosynthesis protein|nr:EscU/YscU/HrcU family type III secretion system export apparatus switch protein [Treponema sp.]